MTVAVLFGGNLPLSSVSATEMQVGQMAAVVVYVKDFRLGTEIADVAARIEKEIVFPDDVHIGGESISDDTEIVIVDWNEEQFRPVELVRRIRFSYPSVPIVGLLAHVRKRLHDEAKEAGCTWVLPRSSFVQNLPTLIEGGRAEPE